jgi:hypothetical protein
MVAGPVDTICFLSEDERQISISRAGGRAGKIGLKVSRRQFLWGDVCLVGNYSFRIRL